MFHVIFLCIGSVIKKVNQIVDLECTNGQISFWALFTMNFTSLSAVVVIFVVVHLEEGAVFSAVPVYC